MTEVSQSTSRCLQDDRLCSRTDIITGKMLRLIHGQLKDNGHVFLVLPRPCIENSRYLDNELLTRIMRHVGFKEVVRKDKEGAKVVYSLWQKLKPIQDSAAAELATKRVLRTGGKRNNFCVLLK
jgi:25S rRNA (adenine2142-N1)-methyltransferase